MLAQCLAIAIHLNGISHHFDAARDYNERNWGAGASCEYEQGRRWSADVFRDSRGNTAGYVAHEWDLAEWRGVRTGIMAGAMRHKTFGGKLPAFPFASPYTGVDVGPAELRITGVPRIGDDIPGLLAAQLRTRF